MIAKLLSVYLKNELGVAVKLCESLAGENNHHPGHDCQ